MNCGIMTLLFSLSMIFFIYDLACSPMLVDALAKVIACILERVFMLDSGFMSPVAWARMTETTKSADVLLPIGRKQLCYIYVSFALFTLHTLLNAVIRCLQLNTNGGHGC